VQTGTGFGGMSIGQYSRSDAPPKELASFAVVNCVRVRQETKPIDNRPHVAE
jgi:hypothetical protein